MGQKAYYPSAEGFSHWGLQFVYSENGVRFYL
jgi:hypothetical protein